MVFISLIDSVPELLYKHNCVIIPGFGGFITNFKASGFEESRNLISPSCKKVAFNQSLTDSDGLLVDHWSRKKGIPYKEALKDVESFSDFLKERIFTNKSFDFKNIGTFYLNSEHRVIFVPYHGLNFLESSYGLPPVKIKPLVVQPSFVVRADAIASDEREEITGPLDVQNELESIPVERPLVRSKSIPPFRNWIVLKAASIVLVTSFTIYSLYYLAKNNKITKIDGRTKTEEKASIINIDSNTGKNAEEIQPTVFIPEYSVERKKMTELQIRLDSISQNNLATNETYKVMLGYYITKEAAERAFKNVVNNYTNARIGDKTDSGYCIEIETFYKHTTAATFSVLLRQSGYKNVKIEKQLVLESH